MIGSGEIFIEQREYEQTLLRDTTREERQHYVETAIQQVQEGRVDPIKIQVQLKSVEDMIEMFQTNSIYKAALLEADEKHGKKFTMYNGEFQIAEAGVKYSYDNCNDPEIKSLHTMLKSVQEDIKIREKFLKGLPAAGVEILDKETAELIRVYPPAKSSTTIVKTTLK